MSKYFQTPTGYGYVDDSEEIPPGSTEITQAEYEALANAEQEAAEQAAAEAIAAAHLRWTTVHDDLVAAGITEQSATLLANAVGLNPNAG